MQNKSDVTGPLPPLVTWMELLSACSIGVLSIGVLWAIVVVVDPVWAMHVPFSTIQKSDNHNSRATAFLAVKLG